jgi:hypothetical protein
MKDGWMIGINGWMIGWMFQWLDGWLKVRIRWSLCVI